MISHMDAIKDRTVIGLKDYERALVWIEGRFSHSPAAWVYAYWATLLAVKLDDRRH